MLQIKTIKKPIQSSTEFDAEVNAAILEGWQLTKRATLGPVATHVENPNVYAMLYAELEREVITEAERCCENCAHYDKGPGDEPCRNCGDDANKWEPAT